MIYCFSAIATIMITHLVVIDNFFQYKFKVVYMYKLMDFRKFIRELFHQERCQERLILCIYRERKLKQMGKNTSEQERDAKGARRMVTHY